MTTAPTATCRYVWAADPQAQWISPDRLIENRYQAISPQLWLDTQPHESPDIILPLPSQAIPYTQLYQYQLHLPQLHGFCSLKRAGEPLEVPLLENIPIDREGKLLPSLLAVWKLATPLNQVYWLWQIISLWAPLVGTGVLSSLAVMDNIRVDGWRIRLCELIPDRAPSRNKVTLATLGTLWSQTLIEIAPEINHPLCALFSRMQSGKASLRYVAAELNRLLLDRAAQLPLRWQIAGGTDAGTTHHHNEDSYYPRPVDLVQDTTGGKIAIVCDGVAGHDGGEVASHMAVKLLKIQAQILLDNLRDSQEIATPEQVCKTIAAIIRVVNNTITVQNQLQDRTARQRMGTTMVMALQVNQQVDSASGTGDSHEIYIAHIGDSRAYWITSERCQLLTIDDDIATREVKQGRDVAWHSASRADATALTQALGMQTGELIQPTVQRLMAIEDGVLLLCSDGLSDRALVENSWQAYSRSILNSELPLTEAVRSWLSLAHQTNGDDNISLVLMSCQVSQPSLLEQRREIVPTATANSARKRSNLTANRVISAVLFLVTGISAIAALVMAVGILSNNQHESSNDNVSEITSPK